MKNKTLSQLLRNAKVIALQGDENVEISGRIRFDSRQVLPGDVFVAVRGAAVDGHQFIDKAVENGAIAIVQSDGMTSGHPVTTVVVNDSAEALGLLAAAYYDNPSHDFQLVGVTGTNGKTTVATLLHQLFTSLGYRCGLIGTVENRIGEERLPSTHTTPDPVSLQEMLRKMADAGCTYVFMEVSSHAVHQRRIAGCRFAGGVFTNLTHDHLDYHGTFAEYRDAKKQFFDELPAEAFALTNADDKNGAFLLQNTRAARHTYALKKPADFKAKIIENSLTGLHLELDGQQLHARLIGEFNAYNLAAVYGAAVLLQEQLPKTQQLEKSALLVAISDLRGAEGRFDYLNHPSKANCIGIVDYAHTPDALEKVLETIQKLKKPSSRIITVVGCGGDRDRAKRPVMARTAARLSDQLILTSDNPRTEEPGAILRDMEAGLLAEDFPKTLIIENREQAIKTACRLCAPTDIVLVAGKGHEKYQEVNGIRHPFDDKEILRREMQ